MLDGEPLPCAAWALAFALKRPGTKPSGRAMLQMRGYAHYLATELGWGPFVTVANLEKFVQLPDMTHYRVTVLSRDFHALNHYRAEGQDFVYNADDLSNLLYLWLDPAMEHYAAVPAERVQAVYCSALNTRAFKFCHKCGTGFSSKALAPNQGPPVGDVEERLTRSCLCEDTEGKTYKRQKKICKTCNEWGCGYECAKSCRYCLTKGIHRCIIYSDPDAKVKEFWTEEDGIPTSIRNVKPRLWVYDLEAAVSRTEVWGIDFERTANGANFVVDEDNVPQVFEARYMKHTVNLVVLRCVFSGLEKVFDGEDCVADFLHYILGINLGFNICIAHNGSGYDTRHIVDAATRVTDHEMKPLSRGCKFMQLKLGNSLKII